MKKILLFTALLLAAGHGRHKAHAQPATPHEILRVTRETSKGIQQLLRAYNDAVIPAATDPHMADARTALENALYQASEALDHLAEEPQ